MSRTTNYVSGVKDAVRRRAGGRCERCGELFNRRQGGLTDASFHHRFKKEFGGRDSVSNLIYVHRSCHDGFHRDEEWSAQFGHILYDDSSVWRPILLRVEGRSEWVLLTQEGTYSFLEDGMLVGDLLRDNAPSLLRRKTRSAA